MTDHSDLEFHKNLIKSGRLQTEIFKYTKITDDFINSLSECKLLFKSPLEFNDPFDGQINDQTNWTQEYIREFVDQNPQAFSIITRKIAREQPPELFGSFFQTSLRHSIEKIGVSCFSTTNDNLLLWSHYADSHKGLCLSFDITQHPIFFVWTLPMIYSDKYPDYDYIKNRRELVSKIIMTKSDHWSYENEIRVLQKTNGLFSFNPNCLKDVTFGSRVSQVKIDEIKMKLSPTKFKNIKFKQTKLHKYNYGLDLIDI
jgi:hypothetical protein